MKGREAAYTISFMWFLYPITVSTVSWNYSFVFLLPFILLRDGKVKRPPPIASALIGLFSLVFILASMYQIQFLDYGIRRFVSFVVFMSVFSYMFIEIDAEMIRAFKRALVIISLAFALSAISQFALLGGSNQDSGIAKNLIGSQRFGFIYLMAIWVVFLHERPSIVVAGAKYLILLVLVSGLMLTFSRSAVVALVASFGVFVLSRNWVWIRRPRLRLLMKAFASIIGIGIIVVAVSKLLPLAVTFFDVRLYAFLLDANLVATHLADPGTSEGTRVFLAARIVEFVMNNPLTGSGYLGVWILSDTLSGSAHNQYTDVLFRTGLLGFAAYSYLLLRLLKYLAVQEAALFWGFVGVLVYGMFHETFKDSQGAFVLAFLLGMLAQRMREMKNRRRMSQTGRDPAGVATGESCQCHREAVNFASGAKRVGRLSSRRRSKSRSSSEVPRPSWWDPVLKSVRYATPD